MKKYLLWIYSFTLLFAIDDSDFFPYVSPGIQIGLNGEGNFFFSIQITGGIVAEGLPLTLGTTIGKRYIYDNTTNKFANYTYLDGQICVLGLAGFGIGNIGRTTEFVSYNQNGVLEKEIIQEKYSKYKFFIGAFGLLSYDYITSPVGRHNFGLFGVFPVVLSNDFYSL